MIKSCEETPFLILILRRVVQDREGPMIVQNSVDSTDNVSLRYQFINVKNVTLKLV